MDKKVILHIDDIWSSQSSNKAAITLLTEGLASSGSIMVPCEWFNDLIIKKELIKELDLWIHLTLNSERININQKRKPTLPLEEVKSLIDDEWYFLPTVEETLYKADWEEIKKELINQILILKKSWIEPSHMDSHMWVLLHKKFFRVYKDLAKLFNLQPFISNPTERIDWKWFYDCESYIKDLSDNLWFKVFDNFDNNSLLGNIKNYHELCDKRISSIKEWTTYFIIHVMDDKPSKKEETIDSKSRIHEYNYFKSWKHLDLLKKLSIKLISTKEV